jgi:hypothetical protein
MPAYPDADVCGGRRKNRMTKRVIEKIELCLLHESFISDRLRGRDLKQNEVGTAFGSAAMLREATRSAVIATTTGRRRLLAESIMRAPAVRKVACRA